jgi:hypothetical protein
MTPTPDVTADADKITIHTPLRWQHFVVLASYIKRVLVTGKMNADMRLRFLECLNGFGLKAEALAAIEPADDVSAS